MGFPTPQPVDLHHPHSCQHTIAAFKKWYTEGIGKKNAPYILGHSAHIKDSAAAWFADKV